MDAALDVPVRTTTRGRDILMQEETLVPQVRVHAPMNCQYIACARAQSHDWELRGVRAALKGGGYRVSEVTGEVTGRC